MLRSRFLWKLFAGYVLLILVTTALIGLLVAHRIAGSSLEETRTELRTRALLLQDLSRPHLRGEAAGGLQEQVRRLGAEISTRLTVVRADGRVLADSDEDPSAMDNHAARPEIARAREEGVGTETRFSKTLGREMMYLALPVRDGGKLLGYVRTSLPLATVEDRLAELQSSVLLGAGVAVLVGLAIGFFFARRVTRPVSQMTGVARAFADGNYDERAKVSASDEIGALAESFNRMADQLKDRLETITADRSKLRRLESVRRDFVANVSHELKTPLTAIRGLVETILDDAEMNADTRQGFLERIRVQSARLSTLVTDLLTLSRVESEEGELEMSEIDLREPVQESIQSHAGEGESRGIAVESEIPAKAVPMRGDPETLRQVVDNLLSNALNYTPEGGRIWVRLRVEGGAAVIEVQDTGVGIEPKDQERIFERFYRVDKARSREMGGTGLGLSIVKHIALAHRGEVSVESAPGKGSAFRVRLPLRT